MDVGTDTQKLVSDQPLVGERKRGGVTDAGAWRAVECRGIGKATAELMVANGWNVLACDVDKGGLASLRTSPSLVTMPLDVSDEEAVKKAVAFCVQRFGSLDCMFANAGVAGGLDSFLDFEGEEFDRVMKVNVNGVFYCFKHAALEMLKSKTKGSLIATASVAGIRSGAGSTPYSASKAAVINMVQTCANQLAGSGIRVNGVAPGLIETGMTAPLFKMAEMNNARNRIGQLNPLRRYGVASEIASVVQFLASDGASYVNGQTIAVCGGLSSSHPVVPAKSGKAAM